MNPRPTILVVDDDADVCQAARIALMSLAERVVMTASPDAMASALQVCRFDCVLLDMNFVVGERSGAVGLSALAMVKAADPQLGVVLMTAYGGVSLAVQSLKRGAHNFVLKPWRNHALVDAVCAASLYTRNGREADTLGGVERAAVARALERHGGNISQTAAALGLSRPALYRRIDKHGL